MLNQKKFWIIVFTIFTVLNGLLFFFSEPIKALINKSFSLKSEWYAVHLTDGQVYFGHIKSISSDKIKLTEASFLEGYELKTTESTPKTTSFQVQSLPKKTYSLVRQGSDNVASSDGTIYINRSAVLFWEKLNNDSEIVKKLTNEP